MDVIGYALAQAIPATSPPAGAGASTVVTTTLAQRSGSAWALLADGTVFTAGGTNGPYNTQTWVIDPASGVATAKAAISQRTDAAASRLTDGRILVSGGTAGTYLADSVLYNPTTNTYAAGPSANNKAKHSQVTVTNGDVWQFGGQSASGTHNFAEKSVGGTAAFGAAVTMPGVRARAAAALLGNNVILAAGIGSTANGLPTWLFDPVATTFTAKANIEGGRPSVAGSAISSSQLLLSGGTSGTDTTLTTYDLTLNRFVGAPGYLVDGRESHGQVTLSDGRVFIGGSSNPPGLTSGEIYVPAVSKPTAGRASLLAHLAAK